MTPLDDERSAGLVATEADRYVLRDKAARRLWLCSGAGFALLGRPALAIATYLAALAAIGISFWPVLAPSVVAFAAAATMIVFACAFWMAEVWAVRRLSPQPPRPAFLVGGFPFASALGFTLAVPLAVLLFTGYGSFRMAGAGMAPTLDVGEQFFYRKRVEPAELQPGKVIVYRLSARSAWGQAGLFMTGRILAAPGDRLSISNDRYVVNGQAASSVGPLGPYKPVIEVPPAPETLTVPDRSYFIVQESPANAYDSRVLFWADSKDLVSTELYYLRRNALLDRVQ
jgi:signal peptidase I